MAAPLSRNTNSSRSSPTRRNTTRPRPSRSSPNSSSGSGLSWAVRTSKANSILWIRDGKDALALGNITGAMVFQATVPVAVGLAFTSWRLDRFAFLAGSLAIAGGIVAHVSLNRGRRFAGPAIVAWSILFAAFAASVWILAFVTALLSRRRARRARRMRPRQAIAVAIQIR